MKDDTKFTKILLLLGGIWALLAIINEYGGFEIIRNLFGA